MTSGHDELLAKAQKLRDLQSHGDGHRYLINELPSIVNISVNEQTAISYELTFGSKGKDAFIIHALRAGATLTSSDFGMLFNRFYPDEFNFLPKILTPDKIRGFIEDPAFAEHTDKLETLLEKSLALQAKKLASTVEAAAAAEATEVCSAIRAAAAPCSVRVPAARAAAAPYSASVLASSHSPHPFGVPEEGAKSLSTSRSSGGYVGR